MPRIKDAAVTTSPSEKPYLTIPLQPSGRGCGGRAPAQWADAVNDDLSRRQRQDAADAGSTVWAWLRADARPAAEVVRRIG